MSATLLGLPRDLLVQIKDSLQGLSSHLSLVDTCKKLRALYGLDDRDSLNDFCLLLHRLGIGRPHALPKTDAAAGPATWVMIAKGVLRHSRGCKARGRDGSMSCAIACQEDLASAPLYAILSPRFSTEALDRITSSLMMKELASLSLGSGRPEDFYCLLSEDAAKSRFDEAAGRVIADLKAIDHFTAACSFATSPPVRQLCLRPFFQRLYPPDILDMDCDTVYNDSGVTLYDVVLWLTSPNLWMRFAEEAEDEAIPAGSYEGILLGFGDFEKETFSLSMRLEEA